MSRPDDTIHVSQFAHASDAALHVAFDELRSRASDLAPDSTRAEIADLELEAIRRGLTLPSVAEAMPAELALRRCMAAVRLGYDSRITEWLQHVELAGLWRIWNASRPHDEAIRVLIMRPLLFHVESRVFSAEQAALRSARLAASPLSPAEELPYLDQCTCAFINLAIAYNCMPW